jgi:hypothetical protein
MDKRLMIDAALARKENLNCRDASVSSLFSSNGSDILFIANYFSALIFLHYF